MDIFRFHKGDTPLLISVPHAGTYVPDAIATQMTQTGRDNIDSDRHVDLLYDFTLEMGASMLVATHSRYVVDLNRPADDENLYPGQDTTGLCPVTSFDHVPLYQDDYKLFAEEISARVPRYWRPYHDKLASELARIKARHGYALLWDAHSIKSNVPRFFDGRLPDINLGTANGESCGVGMGEALFEDVKENPDYSVVLNGRFKGGHITRHYGAPSANIHAVQLELSQATYMQETTPFDYMPEISKNVQPVLKNLLSCFLSSR